MSWPLLDTFKVRASSLGHARMPWTPPMTGHLSGISALHRATPVLLLSSNLTRTAGNSWSPLAATFLRDSLLLCWPQMATFPLCCSPPFGASKEVSLPSVCKAFSAQVRPTAPLSFRSLSPPSFVYLQCSPPNLTSRLLLPQRPSVTY